MNIVKLQIIKEQIENMNKYQQIEILKLFIKNSVIYSENNNGTFVNLSDLSDNILNKLEDYIKFVDKQNNQLLTMEEETANLKREFFKEDKRNIKIKSNKENSNVGIDE